MHMLCWGSADLVRYCLSHLYNIVYTYLQLEYAASFFLLAGNLRDAVHICLNQLDDIQLAIAIARACEGDEGPVLREILEERALPEAAADGNRWMASWAFWMLNHHDAAVSAIVVRYFHFITFCLCF